MSRRGSAQFLLLSLRARKLLGWTTGVVAAVVFAAGLVQTGRVLSLPPETGFAQMLRQSAWQRALAGLPERTEWPWSDIPSETASSVPRLGLSASVVKNAGAEANLVKTIERIDPGPAKDPHLDQSQFGVSIGDHITVTGADGSSRVYRVTGDKVVDPHLAETDPISPEADPSRVSCQPLESLLASSLQRVMQAGKAEQPAPSEAEPEHKL